MRRRWWTLGVLVAALGLRGASAQDLTPLAPVLEIPGKPKKAHLAELPGKPKRALPAPYVFVRQPGFTPPHGFAFSRITWPVAGKLSGATWDEVSSWKMWAHPTPGKNLAYFTRYAWWTEDFVTLTTVNIEGEVPTFGNWCRSVSGQEGGDQVAIAIFASPFLVPVGVLMGVIGTTLDVLALPHRLCGVGPNGVKWKTSRNYPVAALLWLPVQPAALACGVSGTVGDALAFPHRLGGLGPNGARYTVEVQRPDPAAQAQYEEAERYNAQIDSELARLNAEIDRHNAAIDAEIRAYNDAVDRYNAAIAAGKTAPRPKLPTR